MRAQNLCRLFFIWLGVIVTSTAPLADVGTNKSATNRITTLSPAERAAALQKAQRAEKIRAACIEGRRYVAGRVMQVTTNGLAVDSGYASLLQPPFNQSWVVRSTASVEKDSHMVEENHPDAVCVGLVWLANTPKRPQLKLYDYVVIHAYPAGEQIYRPVPGVEKKLRRFSASLENAILTASDHCEK